MRSLRVIYIYVGGCWAYHDTHRTEASQGLPFDLHLTTAYQPDNDFSKPCFEQSDGVLSIGFAYIGQDVAIYNDLFLDFLVSGSVIFAIVRRAVLLGALHIVCVTFVEWNLMSDGGTGGTHLTYSSRRRPDKAGSDASEAPVSTHVSAQIWVELCRKRGVAQVFFSYLFRLLGRDPGEAPCSCSNSLRNWDASDAIITKPSLMSPATSLSTNPSQLDIVESTLSAASRA